MQFEKLNLGFVFSEVGQILFDECPTKHFSLNRSIKETKKQKTFRKRSFQSFLFEEMYLPTYCQCDQIGRFIGVWATF